MVPSENSIHDNGRYDNSRLVAALEYARLGYAVLPLMPGEKRPHPELVPRGLKGASQEGATLEGWWRRVPEAGVGLLPGEGVLVLDADGREAAEALLARWPALRQAPRARTPRGGVHLYLRLPEAALNSLRTGRAKGLELELGPVDLKGLGRGYLVAPPTALPAGGYAWEVPLVAEAELPRAPDDLLAVLLPPPPEAQGFREATPERLERLLEAFARRVAATPPGERHTTLIRYARAAGGLIPHGLDPQAAERALVEAALQAGLPEGEAQAAVAWGLEVGRAAPLEVGQASPLALPHGAGPLDGLETRERMGDDPRYRLQTRERMGDGPRYRVHRGRLEAATVEGRGKSRSVLYYPLGNFAAVIRREVALTDGLEAEHLLELDGYLDDGTPLGTARVLAGEFPGMGWLTRAWGGRAVLFAGQGMRDHARAAIQLLSLARGYDRATVYRHLGWTWIGGRPVYLHAGGGIGPEGAVSEVEVEPPRPLRGFVLPPPPAEEEARAVWREILALWPRLGPPEVTWPLLLFAVGAPLGHTPFALYLAGATGARKTSLALVAQGFFTPGQEGPPLGWEATANAVEESAFQAKDALLLVDDYAPTGSEARRRELIAKVSRVIRNQGNLTGRARMRADGSLAPDRPPRSSLLITGEDLPPGHSVRARTLVLELRRGDVDLDALSQAQRLARDGTLARAMSAWIHYLAQHLEDHQRVLREATETLRPHWASLGEHGRTVDAGVRLHAVLVVFFAYMQGLGIDLAPEEVLPALTKAVQEQASWQRDADPVERFVPLLLAALSAGYGHILPEKDGDIAARAPHSPALWGWRWRESLSSTDGPAGTWDPRGPALGWFAADGGLLLDPPAAYAVVNRLAGENGEPLPWPRTLWKQLGERGLIRVAREGREQRYQVRTRIGGALRRVVHLLPHAFAQHVSPTSQKPGTPGTPPTSAVQDAKTPVPGSPSVPGDFREQHAQGKRANGTFPEISGNTQKTGNTRSVVQDAKTAAVPGVPGNTEIGGTPGARKDVNTGKDQEAGALSSGVAGGFPELPGRTRLPGRT